MPSTSSADPETLRPANPNSQHPAHAGRACSKCRAVKLTSDFELLPTGNLSATCTACKTDARREAEFQAKMRSKERELERRDDLWSAAATGRMRRGGASYQPTSTQRHKVKETFGGGYISVAELACRCAEREFIGKVARSRGTPEEHLRAVRMLEDGADSLTRRVALRDFFGQRPEQVAANADETTADPFAAAFAPWSVPTGVAAPVFV